MTAKAAPEPAGTNSSLFFGGLCGIAAWYLWPEQSGSWQQQAFAGMLAGTSVIASLKGVRCWAKDIRIRKKIMDSEHPGTDHGSAREATEQELADRGLFDPSSGNLLGFKFGRAIFSPADTPFSLYEAPPGSGKDIYFCIGNILHRSLLGYSVFAPDVKLELGPMLIAGLREMGCEVWGINPTEQFMDVCGNIELGLYQSVLDAIYSSPSSRKDAVGIVGELAKLHLPDDKADGNKKYFIGGSQRCLSIPPLLYALIDPARCTPADSFDLLNDPKHFTRNLKTIVNDLEPFVEDDRIVAFLKSEARNLLDRAEKNPENLGSFLEWATQALGPYNQAGHLADYGHKAINNIKEMCERPITAFPMTPHSHTIEFESFTSILNANLLSACKRNPKKQRVHLCCNEFLNYRFANVASDLEVIRGLGVTADFFIQSFSGLVRKYGKEAAASVNDYCDVKVYAGLNSYERAKYVSDMLSESTISAKDYSYKSSPDDVNVSTKRLGRRLMTPDEILAMPRDEAWVFVKGLRPFKVKLFHYGHVEPWSAMVADNPLEGPPLKGETFLKINYPDRNCP